MGKYYECYYGWQEMNERVVVKINFVRIKIFSLSRSSQFQFFHQLGTFVIYYKIPPCLVQTVC